MSHTQTPENGGCLEAKYNRSQLPRKSWQLSHKTHEFVLSLTTFTRLDCEEKEFLYPFDTFKWGVRRGSQVFLKAPNSVRPLGEERCADESRKLSAINLKNMRVNVKTELVVNPFPYI